MLSIFKKINQKRKIWLPYVVVFLALCFDIYSFFLQIAPGVIEEDLAGFLHVNSITMAQIIGVFFYSYALAQVPAGMFMDRFGARVIMVCSLLLTSAGGMLFVHATTVHSAMLGRFVMGIGSSCGYISVLFLARRWLAPAYFPWTVGLAEIAGSLGALFAETPLVLIVKHVGWQPTFRLIAEYGLVLAVLVFFMVRDAPAGVRYLHSERLPLWQGFARILKQRHNLTVAIYSFMIWAPVLCLAAVWGMPFFEHVYGLSALSASEALSGIWLGIASGSIFIVWLSNRLKSRRYPFIIFSALGLVVVIILLSLHSPPFFVSVGLMFFLGMSASSVALTFSALNDLVSREIAGTAMGFNNMAVVLGGPLLQVAVGAVLHWHKLGASYVALDYRIALSPIVLCYLSCLFISSFLLRESYPQSTQ